MARRLNHLKFGSDGASPPSLKAYFYFGLIVEQSVAARATLSY